MRRGQRSVEQVVLQHHLRLLILQASMLLMGVLQVEQMMAAVAPLLSQVPAEVLCAEEVAVVRGVRSLQLLQETVQQVEPQVFFPWLEVVAEQLVRRQLQPRLEVLGETAPMVFTGCTRGVEGEGEDVTSEGAALRVLVVLVATVAFQVVVVVVEDLVSITAPMVTISVEREATVVTHVGV